ncbi:MAG: sigma 54-interacting transcriptional regulator [Bacillota bacterium]
MTKKCLFFNEEMFLIFNSLFNGVIMVDPEGKILFCNSSAAKCLGVEVEQVVGRPVTQLLPLENLFEQVISGAGYTGEKISLNEKGSVLSNCLPVKKDQGLLGSIIIFQDLSEIVKKQESLQALEELNRELNALIESSYDGIWITDGKGVTLRVSKSYEKFSGIKAEEVVGRSMEELVKEGYYSDSAALHVLARKEPVTLVHEIKTGKKAMVTASPVFDDQGNIWRIIANVRDITLLDDLQKQLAEMRRLSQRYEYELRQMRELNGVKIIGESKAIQDVINLALRLAGVDTTVFIQGESGVGKGLVAELIHRHSQRKNGPFIKLNCGAIPENLLESELFGYEKGAFTGACKEGKPGMFELANKGILFLDEITELPLHLQVKLLQAVQDQEIYRVGGTRLIRLDVRIIAATNKDVAALVAKGLFREDLYYRLNVVPVVIPPLRERKEDIPILINYYINLFDKKFNLKKKISSSAVDYLTSYHWPGNVRELENVVQRLVLLSPGEIIEVDDLPKHILGEKKAVHDGYVLTLPRDISMREALEEVEKKLLKMALMEQGSTRRAAKQLAIDQSTVVRKAQKYKIEYNKVYQPNLEVH